VTDSEQPWDGCLTIKIVGSNERDNRLRGYIDLSFRGCGLSFESLEWMAYLSDKSLLERKLLLLASITTKAREVAAALAPLGLRFRITHELVSELRERRANLREEMAAVEEELAVLQEALT
jgi:hypothetical protein